MRVLLIEDEPTTAKAIELMLTTEGFNVYTTDLGEEGLDLGKLYDYDIILLDLNLPDMTGVDILEKVKNNQHTKLSPVVVLTTTDDEREIQRCYDLGANVYITKPVDYESFANAIRQLGMFFSIRRAWPSSSSIMMIVTGLGSRLLMRPSF